MRHNGDVMFQPTRAQARRFFFDTWARYRAGLPLEGAQTLALETILAHSEYHAVLEDAERYGEREYFPEQGETNPFLHLALHVALLEQLAIDQPAGIRAHYERLCQALGDAMQAQHTLMECLAEALWQSQRQGMLVSEAAYADCIRRRAGAADTLE